MAAICLYAKVPEPGRCKSRLARDIGEEWAATLSAAMLRDLACELRSAARGADVCWLWHPPDDAPQAFPVEVAAFAKAPQKGPDLGARMQHTMATLLPSAGKVIIVGSDCITMGAAMIRTALGALDTQEVVLQPSNDGGYTLIGMSRLCKNVFADIAWGSDQVWPQTVAKLKGMRWRQLPATFDVDTVEDLARLRAFLAVHPRVHTRDWMRRFLARV
jgi:rSAM/selenodomain-associated transferase 1